MDKGEIIIYQSESGNTKLDIKLVDETLWVTQQQIAELFQTTKQNVSLHLKNIYEEGELNEEATVKEYLTVRKEGKRDVQRSLIHYNLDTVLSVGYRVHSVTATKFRIWATQQLKEYLIKGFVMDDERLMDAKSKYFDELLDRIRNIRSSEKIFYRKVCDVFATSVDYAADTDTAKVFFASVQNKFHWAISGNTAAEIVYKRADINKPNMGLTNYPGEQIRKKDVSIAKNYLKPEELDSLNRIVNQYLEFAELQAKNRKAMHMADWTQKLHGFLTLNDMEILGHKGKISAIQAKEKAQSIFSDYQQNIEMNTPDELDKALIRLKQLKEKDD